MAKIVVPVDFSECSEINCTFSLKLASQIKAELMVLHCFNETGQYPVVAYMDKVSVPYPINSPLQTSNEKETKEALENFLDNLKAKRDKLGYSEVPISQHIVYGAPADEIIHFCEEEKPDMLLLSSGSSGDKVKKILGSLSYHLLKSVKVSVMVIPREMALNLDNPLKIAFVSRFEENELRSMNQLIRIISGFTTSLTILHVGSSEDDPKYLQHLRRIREQLASFYKKHKVDFELIADADWIEGIKNFADQENIDIISFTTKPRGFFAKFFNPGMTKSLLFDYNKPLLVFHA
ncbi:MAG: universal stress protein [Bacteroidales bacterium]|nr:universal stress protein [Bacteroidales bacterium]MCF8456932.1 universal stress protein [Bacteroidales bacterium]